MDRTDIREFMEQDRVARLMVSRDLLLDSKDDGKRDYIVDMNWAVECLKNK